MQNKLASGARLGRQALLFPLCLVLYEFSTYIGNDMIQPGMLAVVEQYQAGIDWVPTSMTAYLAGGMFLQWLLGPLSDRIGRRPVMLAGVVWFIVTCLAILLAQNIEQFTLLRFLQGISLCFIGAVGYAAIQESFEEAVCIKITALMANVALRAQTDRIILGGMGLTNDDYLYFKNLFDNAGVLDRIVSFVNTTEAPPVERLLVPDMALTAAEYFAVDKNEKVLVLLTDMTLYADALSIVSNRMDQIPSKDSMPGSLYSDLAKIYEKAVQFPAGGSITIIAVTTLSGGDITHAIPDNTGYITEGQLFLRKDTEIGKVIVDPFRSLSRLKQLVIGKKTRKDHPQVMNAAIRLYADAANARTKLENGFDLTDYDRRTLEFARDYSNELLAIDVNIGITQMLDTAWALFRKYFTRSELGIKKEIVDEFGNYSD